MGDTEMFKIKSIVTLALLFFATGSSAIPMSAKDNGGGWNYSGYTAPGSFTLSGNLSGSVFQKPLSLPDYKFLDFRPEKVRPPRRVARDEIWQWMNGGGLDGHRVDWFPGDIKWRDVPEPGMLGLLAIGLLGLGFSRRNRKA